MSEDVKVGSEWTWDGTEEGYLANSPMTVSSAKGGWVHYTYRSTGARMCRRHEEFLLHARRLPREAASVEERRAALRVGQVITDPALLAKGMRVLGVSGLSVTLSEPREDPTGWNDADTPRFLSDEACAEYGVTFLGWAQEEKAGDEPVKLPCHLTMGTEPLCGARDIHFFQTTDVVDEADCPACLEIAKRAKPPADKPAHAPTGLIHLLRADGGTFCGGFGMRQGDTVTGNADQFTCEDCRRMWAPHYQPSPPPRGLPFKYLEWCSQKAQHDGKALCLTCEGLIAEREAGRFVMESPPQRPEPHRPSDTGMGGACGPVMGRLR